MFIPSNLLTHGFKKNRMAQEQLFKQLCNFGAQAWWWKERIVVSFYLDVETTKYQCRLLNTTPLKCITGYLMENDVGDRALKRMPHIRLNFIDGYISSCCLIINSPKKLEQIWQENKLTSVLCYLDSNSMRGK